MHEPVLYQEIIDFFSPLKMTTFVDGTVGLGGHAIGILTAHPEIQRFYGIDRDWEALNHSRIRLAPFQEKVVLHQGSFTEIDELVEGSVEGILLDLGVSSLQLDCPDKGFSFYKEGPLDMRMDPSQVTTAEEIVNKFSEQNLGQLFKEYGEERKWRQAAKAIVEARRKKRITTTKQLREIVEAVIPWGGRKIHPATLVFQAIRIKVNEELILLQEVLPKAIALLAPGGRLGVISFHSLEDRIVKEQFRKFCVEEKSAHLLTRKPIVAQDEERKKNRRSRSAKLRFLEKKCA
ncbi:MAG: 16S rRNA (cytosine(1402)-N(4))-methyltransferase RsmH [Chlamydiales bacterium]